MNERMGRVGFTLDDLEPQNPHELEKLHCTLVVLGVAVEEDVDVRPSIGAAP